MMFNPKVSIIIPVYNGSNYLAEAIDSALTQIYKNIEILVINDGSSDNGKTEIIAKSYGDKIRYIHKENGGVATALNMGIEKMTGEYFSWLSHDDLYYPTKIEEQVKFIGSLKDKNVVVSSDVELIDKNGIHKQFLSKKYDENEIISKLLFNGVINGCTLLIPRISFDKVGTFNKYLQTTQDYELWFRLVKEYKFKHMSECLVKSREHPCQDSKNKFLLSIKETTELESFVLKNFSIATIKSHFKSKLPNNLFIIYLKGRFILRRLFGYLIFLTIKLNMYKYMSYIWKKIMY